jgi:ectoine hydroxylase-related dioxygenase (phytanoyl-CoA dioxygenase family)
LFYLMVEGPVFEAALMNPVVQGLVRYMLGDALLLSSASATLKGPGKLPFFLHSDQPIHPSPQALVCNATYLLSDYTRENGALCFVPGSHRMMRQPLPSENFDFGGLDPRAAMDDAARDQIEHVDITEAPNIVPVTAPAGSLVVWHGNTWHGALNRTTPGLRVNLVLFFCLPALRPQEPYRELMPDEILARNDDRFAGLMGRNVHFGWTSEGPDTRPGAAFERHRQRARTGAVKEA